MRGEAGFSLIEMLVTLTIMALITTLAVLTGFGSSGSLPAEVDRFAAAIASARDLALVENRTVALELSDDGYRVSVLRRISTAPEIVHIVPWQQGTSVSTETGQLPTVVTFDSVGLTDPAQLTFYKDGASENVSISQSGEIRRSADDQ